MNTTKQFVKLHGKAFHCTRNIAFSCIQTTSDLQRKLILYSFTVKRCYTCSFTRDFPSSTSPTIFLLPHSLLLLVILKEEILQRRVCCPGCMCENVTVRDMKNEHLSNTGCSSLEGKSDDFD